MENFEEMNEQLSKEMMATIEKRCAELKAEKNLKAVFPIVVDGNPDFGEKEHYLAYFSQPSFKTFSKYLSAAQKDQVVAMRVLAQDCFLDGDKDLMSDDSLFLFGLMGQLSKIVEVRHGRLVNLSKPGK